MNFKKFKSFWSKDNLHYVHLLKNEKDVQFYRRLFDDLVGGIFNILLL